MTIQQPAEYGHSQLPDGRWVPDANVPAGQWNPYPWPRAQGGQWAQQQFPQRIVSRRAMNPLETAFHACMTVFTLGLWGIVWAARYRSLKTVTRS